MTLQFHDKRGEEKVEHRRGTGLELDGSRNAI